MKAKVTGFTLIEILIALLIFAILTTLTASSLFYAFDIKKRLMIQNSFINQWQLATSVIKRDISQGIIRAIRAPQGQLLAPFIGQSQYFEFTRGGVINPNFTQKKSTLLRLAFFCRDNALWRRTWAGLDSLERKDYSDQILLGSVKTCAFSYFNSNLQPLAAWQAHALTTSQLKEGLPKAVQFNLVLQNNAQAHLLFIFPEALYSD